MREITRTVLAQKAARDAEITQRPLSRQDRERQVRAAAAAERAEIRRLHRELNPPKPVERPLSQAEQLEALRAATAAKRDGDSRSGKALLDEAVAAVKAKRTPREE